MRNVPRDIALFALKSLHAHTDFPADLRPEFEKLLPDLLDGLERKIREGFAQPRLPKNGETVGVSLDRPKTAALYFDRSWGLLNDPELPPDDILVYGATDIEMWYHAVIGARSSGLVGSDTLVQSLMGTSFPLVGPRKTLPFDRMIAESLYGERGIVARPIFSAEVLRDEQYAPGKTEVLIAALDGIGIISEDDLTWEQVREIRADRDARRKLRRLLHWLDSEMVGKSASFVAAEIAARIDEYDATVRKHGIKTVAGVASALLDPRFVAAASLAAMASSGAWAATAAISLAVARAALSVSNQYIDLQDAKRAAGAEIAFVVEIRGQAAKS